MDAGGYPIWGARAVNRITLEMGELGKRSLRLCEPSPCTVACPGGVNVKSYVSMIADGRFKLVAEMSHPPLLYDLLVDPWEDTDVAADRPEIVERLGSALWAERRADTSPE